MRNSASFRDPSGFVFERDGSVFRQVNTSYRADFERLVGSGLMKSLQDEGLLIRSEILSADQGLTGHAFAVLKPDRVPFISYPYEWSFSQLKDAALLTLDLTLRALENGMILKDASAYNVQFIGGRPVMIDTLSFEIHPEGEPWIAYRQFCQHFLGPLALMSFVDPSLSKLLVVHIDGIPLNLVSKLLPSRTKFNFGLLAHIHVHGGSVDKTASTNVRKVTIPRNSLVAFVQNIRQVVSKLRSSTTQTEWGEYYSDTNYSAEAMEDKRTVYRKFVKRIEPGAKTMWDLGANTAEFSRIASSEGFDVVAWDVDPQAVEKAYLDVRENGEVRLLPLLLDLTNPSPSIGWANAERTSFMQRGPVQVVSALALIHHLCIGNNVPFEQLCNFFASACEWLIIEFVPKEDSQVQRLLASRKDVFEDYNQVAFETQFCRCFDVISSTPIFGSLRTLYLMRRIAS